MVPWKTIYSAIRWRHMLNRFFFISSLATNLKSVNRSEVDLQVKQHLLSVVSAECVQWQWDERETLRASYNVCRDYTRIVFDMGFLAE